jgi:nitroreductase
MENNLKSHLEKRFTAKWWDETPVEKEKLNYILETTYLAPSKQGEYQYEIIVVTNSDQGKEIKQWLYWENTWCYEGCRGKDGADDKRYNGQVLAPVLLIYLVKDQGNNNIEDLTQRNLIDSVISSTVAMCAAQEVGLSTGFQCTFDGKDIALKLGKKDMICSIMLGIGYATPDFRVRRGVYDDLGNRIGFDYSNTDPSLKIDINRTKKPSLEGLIKIL